MKKECPAKVVLAARRASQQLEITAINLDHNHEISSEIYKTYPECRQLNAEEVNFVVPLMELNVQPSLIVEKLRQETGKLQVFFSQSLLPCLSSPILLCLCRKSYHSQRHPQPEMFYKGP